MKDYREVVGTDCHGLSYRQVMDIVELVRPTDFAQNIQWYREQFEFLRFAIDCGRFWWFVSQLHQLWLD